ncbi:MAG: hypothetical protein VX498_15595 [Myxococcota bacterium]|nr:hypothetical protein [Myxococcota bacterium]
MEAKLDIGELLKGAWERFKERPGLCIGMWLIFVILQPSGSGGGGDPTAMQDIPEEVLLVLLAIFLGCTCISVVLGPVIRGGYDLAMLRLVRGEQDVAFGDLFAGFKKFVPLFLTGLLMGIAVLGGLVLCIVPGVILMLGLWPAFLLVMEDDLSPMDALKEAWDLTRGYKGQIFLYAIVAGVIQMAGVMACCVGLLVAGPVTQLGWMGAYNEMRQARAEAAE